MIIGISVISAAGFRLWINRRRRRAGAVQVKGWATNRTERLLVDFVERPGRIHQLAGPIYVAPLHVLGRLARDEEGQTSIELRRIEQDDRVIVPVFGDQERVRSFIRGRTTEQVDVMQLPLHALLSVIEPDEWLMLNPGDEPTLELSPGDLARITDIGHIAADRPRPGQRDGRLLIGAPSETPAGLLDRMTRHLEQHPGGVSAIHLAQRVIVTGETRSEPVLLLGVAADSAEAAARLMPTVNELREQAGEQRAVEVHWLGEESIEATHLREQTRAVWVRGQ